MCAKTLLSTYILFWSFVINSNDTKTGKGKSKIGQKKNILKEYTPLNHDILFAYRVLIICDNILSSIHPVKNVVHFIALLYNLKVNDASICK